MCTVVAMGIDVPNVRNLVFLQVTLGSLTDIDQAIFVAARKEEQLELRFRLGGVWDQLGRGHGIGSRRKSADPSKGIQMRQSKIQRLATAHG